jgi:hypothetical protein
MNRPGTALGGFDTAGIKKTRLSAGLFWCGREDSGKACKRLKTRLLVVQCASLPGTKNQLVIEKWSNDCSRFERGVATLSTVIAPCGQPLDSLLSQDHLRLRQNVNT